MNTLFETAVFDPSFQDLRQIKSGKGGVETTFSKFDRSPSEKSQGDGDDGMPSVFDSLAWNEELDWWSGTAEWAWGHQIDLHVQAENDPDALKAAVVRVTLAWQRLQAAESGVRTAVAEQMTDMHNDLCDPEDEVTTEQFAGRLRLLSALFESGGTLELCYHDGMLFGGHGLMVPVAADGSIGQATEAG